jgi:hypothetical protein
MFNDRLNSETARERIEQRMQEAETYGLQKRLGFSDYKIARWILAFVLLAAMILGWLL